MEVAFSSGEAVAELVRGGERRGAGGEDLELGEDVRTDFQEPAGVGKLMHFIQDQPRLGERAVERLGVGEEMLRGRQVAVEKLGVFEGLGERGLADAAHAGEPDDGNLAPAVLDALKPEGAGDHENSLYVWSDQMQYRTFQKPKAFSLATDARG